MYTASFQFEPGDYDEEFHRLDRLIEEAARATAGFLGKEAWHSPDGARRNATYYWDSLDALDEFSAHPVHLEAKRQYRRWYRGYHILVSEVLRSYGDGAFELPASGGRSA